MSLDHQGGAVMDHEEIREIIYEYYKQLFGSEERRGVTLSENAWSESRRVTKTQNNDLIKPFSIEEAERVVKEMKENIAPGLDELSVAFFKSFWGVIREEIKAMIDDLNENKFDLARLNYGVINLIPKIQEANEVKQYRPICVSNVIFKIFTKMMSNRLTELADSIIGKNQSAFIKGRYIVDSAVILHEVLHELRVKNLQGVVMKIDFEKAYDRINWGFLEEVMQCKGFHKQFIQWVMLTVSSRRVCININGQNGPFFRTYRGLRQGDPISPFLFNLVADTLDFLLGRAKQRGQIQAVVPHLV